MSSGGKSRYTGNTIGHSFSMIPSVSLPRSTFDRSHSWKGTFDAGQLIPFYVDEVYPGDTHSLKSTIFCRLQSAIVPFMDDLILDTQFFFVPNRLIYDKWEQLNGAQDNPGDSTNYLVPQVQPPTSFGYALGDLADYMGLPLLIPSPTPGTTWSHSALPFRAYNKIWNDWYRDENLNNSVTVHVDQGPDPDSDYAILFRRKRKDYFMGCLPFTQKGPAVTLPLGASARVSYDTTAGNALSAYSTAAGAYKTFELQTGATPNHVLSGTTTDTGPNTFLYADLTTATAATVNQLRTAIQIQRMYERDARGGTRYTEICLSHFGVQAPDYRLQRAEYLGGGTQRININPVAQTSASPASPSPTDTPQANLSAFGTSLGNHSFSKSFVEHGILIGLMSVRANYSYQYGLDRGLWSRKSRFDFYYPTFAHLGEQAVLNKELFLSGTVNTDEAVYGYQERYGELRYKNSIITGLYRSNVPASLDVWHLAQDYTSVPALNSGWIRENPPVSRVIALPSEPAFLCDVFNKLTSARPMPVYGIPGQMDHF